jgi:hypothetical protein
MTAIFTSSEGKRRLTGRGLWFQPASTVETSEFLVRQKTPAGVGRIVISAHLRLVGAVAARDRAAVQAAVEGGIPCCASVLRRQDRLFRPECA